MKSLEVDGENLFVWCLSYSASQSENLEGYKNIHWAVYYAFYAIVEPVKSWTPNVAKRQNCERPCLKCEKRNRPDPDMNHETETNGVERGSKWPWVESKIIVWHHILDLVSPKAKYHSTRTFLLVILRKSSIPIKDQPEICNFYSNIHASIFESKQ